MGIVSKEITDSSLSVTLTVGQLREILRNALQGFAHTGGGGDGRLLTPRELAERLKVPVSWVYEQSRMGKLPTHRIGRYIRFDLREVLEHQQAQRVQAAR